MDKIWHEVVIYWTLIVYSKIDGVSTVARQAANARKMYPSTWKCYFHLKVLLISCLPVIVLLSYHFLTCFEIGTLLSWYLEPHWDLTHSTSLFSLQGLKVRLDRGSFLLEILYHTMERLLLLCIWWLYLIFNLLNVCKLNCGLEVFCIWSTLIQYGTSCLLTSPWFVSNVSWRTLRLLYLKPLKYFLLLTCGL